MRGRPSTVKSRLRNAGFKCNLCGRRVIDAATLERHQKNVHSIPNSNRGKKVYKGKLPLSRNKLSDKVKGEAFENNVRDDIEVETKAKSKSGKNVNEGSVVRENSLAKQAKKNEVVPAKKLISVNSPGDSVKNVKKSRYMKRSESENKRRVEFECPVCTKTFNVYFTAHRHIQKYHPVNAEGNQVPSNSSQLVQPIRVEQCVKCYCKTKSTEQHICLDHNVSIASQFVCSACNQTFVNIKTFDLHVAGLHSDGVESLFFPTRLEFTNWRLEMERETNRRYLVVGTNCDTKQVHRCNYAQDNPFNDMDTAHFCPSSMVVQDFSKGIQVHFYKKHYGHPAREYTLANKYIKYSINSFLKSPNDVKGIKAAINGKKLEETDLFPHFKTLMQSIITDARHVDIPKLKVLIERALEMSEVLVSKKPVTAYPVQPLKNMSEKEIADVLEVKDTHKRRMSVDSFEKPKSSPAKRTRNQSVFVQGEDRSSPKIINTFSLAPFTNGDNIKMGPKDVTLEDAVIESTHDISNNVDGSVDEEQKAKKHIKSYSKSTRFSESPSFNDSYKDFIDKTIKANIESDKKVKKIIRKYERNTRSNTVVKTKMGTFVPTSPKTDAKPDVKPDAVDENVIKDVTDDNVDDKSLLTPKKSTPNAANTKHVIPTPKITKVVKNPSTKAATPKSAATEVATTKPVTPKAATSKAAAPKAVTSKASSSKIVMSKIGTPKGITHKVEDVSEVIRVATPPTLLKPKSNFRYEVREQENDCNILVLKF